MPSELTVYKVFIASPNDLKDERQIFVDALEEYNKIEAFNRGVKFQVIRYEDAVAEMGRPQALINEKLKECDFFVLLLHERWGSSPGKNEKNATSGTHEEYLTAVECYENPKLPMKHIACIFKSIMPEKLPNPDTQLQLVLEFKKKIEREKKLLYSTFFGESEFRKILWKQFAFWLLNHENGFDYENSMQSKSVIIAEEAIVPEKLKSPRTQIREQAQNIINHAWELNRNGKETEAEIEFSKALIYNTEDYELLSYAYFLMHIGHLDKAIMILERVVSLRGEGSYNSALAYSYKGTIYRTKGKYNVAEEMFQKALEIYEKLSDLGGIADEYHNLAELEFEKESYVTSNKMEEKALEINKNLNREKEMAFNYHGLANILSAIGNFDEAEDFYNSALSVYKKEKYFKGISGIYGNMGIISMSKGNFDDAIEKHTKSLTINKRINYLTGIAINYANLTQLMILRDDLSKAKKFCLEGIKIEEQLGNLKGMANQYNNLSIILIDKKDLETALSMSRKAVGISKKLGIKGSIASYYLVLGVIFKEQGNLKEANKILQKSYEIANELDLAIIKCTVYSNLGDIMLLTNEIEKAESYYSKSFELAQELEEFSFMILQMTKFGEVAQAKKNYKQAKKNYKKCLKLAKEHDIRPVIRKVKELLKKLKEINE